jgi:hypothetical protein
MKNKISYSILEERASKLDQSDEESFESPLLINLQINMSLAQLRELKQFNNQYRCN